MEDELVDDDLRRAYDLVARGDMGGARTEPSRFGEAVFDDDLPLRYDSNYLLVDRLPGDVPAEDLTDDLTGGLIREARRLDRPAILVRDGWAGERLAAPMRRAGWAVHRGLVMASRRQPERSAPAGVVREVGEAALRPARRLQVAGEPWATPEVVEQLLDAKVAIAKAVEARFFAVLATVAGGEGGGGEVVSYVDLYVDREGRAAQIEHLATLDGYGGRGYASALVLHALAEARLAGCDLVFLLADADDWPKLLYRRLGFDEIGRYIKFIRPEGHPRRD